MSNEYPYEVRDPQRSMEWTVVCDTFNAWASVRAFLKLKGYKPREFVDAPHVFEVRHPYTDPAAIDEVRVSVPLRIETYVRRRGVDRWVRVGKPASTTEEANALAMLRDAAETALRAHAARGMGGAPSELEGCPVGALRAILGMIGGGR